MDYASVITTHVDSEKITKLAIRASLKGNGVIETLRIAGKYNIPRLNVIAIGLEPLIESVRNFGREYVARF